MLTIAWNNPNPPAAPKVVANKSGFEPGTWFVHIQRGAFVPSEFRRFEVAQGGRFQFYRPKRRAIR